MLVPHLTPERTRQLVVPAPAARPHTGGGEITTQHGEIACRAPFDFRRSLAFVRGFGPMHGDQQVGAGEIRKGLVVRGRALTVTVREAEASTPTEPALAYSLRAEAPFDETLARAAEERLRAIFSTDEDLSDFYALAEGDARFAPAVRWLYGLHHVRFPSAFEAACWAAINQRLPRSLARRMKEALCARYGAVRAGGEACLAFPEAEAMAAASEEDLLPIVRSPRRARTLVGLARAFTEVEPSFLAQAPVGRVAEWLGGIYGVGEFTTAFVLFRGLGRYHGLPIASPKLIEAMSAVYGERCTLADLERRLARYGAWGGHYALYLWASTMEQAA